MPPPMPNPQKRMTANPARPVARYRPGKAVQEESSEEEDEEEKVPELQKNRKSLPYPQQASRPRIPVPGADEDDDDEEGFVTDEEDGDEASAAIGPASQQRATDSASIPQSSIPIPQGHSTAKEESDEESEEEDEEDESSEEEESSSEEEAPRRKFQRPTFIKKSDRKTPGSENAVASAQPESSNRQTTTTAASSSTLEIDEQLRRRAQADLYIQDHLERDARARAAGKKHWDDDDELTPEQMIDDTDGLDPESEYQAWKLRELRRLKRDREAIEAREKEIEELERRRNLTQEERDREDADFVARQKSDRDENRGKATYLARYHHKGAFFQDDEMAEVLKKRDIMGAKFADEVSDKSVLPEYMRVRDMTKLGKKGRTRYTDLKGQDTGRFGEEIKRWRGASDDRGGRHGSSSLGGAGAPPGVDERFLPDRDRDRDSGYSRNDRDRNVNGFDRRKRSRSRNGNRNNSRSRSPRRREDDSHYRPRRRSYSHSRSRSRSRTPPRRKRSPSPPYGSNERDKRRRIET